jgi:hypothetical protein
VASADVYWRDLGTQSFRQEQSNWCTAGASRDIDYHWVGGSAQPQCVIYASEIQVDPYWVCNYPWYYNQGLPSGAVVNGFHNRGLNGAGVSCVAGTNTNGCADFGLAANEVYFAGRPFMALLHGQNFGHAVTIGGIYYDTSNGGAYLRVSDPSGGGIQWSWYYALLPGANWDETVSNITW